jgi:asparagine synthase (glutamine-hydrolysing)
MCGIVGFIDFNQKSNLSDLNSMVATINHRGPDDKGVELYENSNAIIGFGQSRLSIIDLTQGGHQPMKYKHYNIVFNGEIYNFNEIKRELINEGNVFISESDTEVILHAFERWGIDSIKKFIGMFAFVIYDNLLNEITIVRDRAGVKPLYYYWHNQLFLFASELKAFHAHHKFEKKINQKAVQQFFSQINRGFIPAPNTIFENTYKLKSGNFLKINLESKTIRIEQYWDVSTFYKQPKIEIDYKEAQKSVHDLLVSASEYRMVADVPVGVFLSGGYDSTAVVAMLQSQRTEKLKTFTIGFEEGNNEIPSARQTANYLGTDHHEYICTTKEAQEIIPTLPFFYDEPFADSSSIPTILVSKFARESVTVALSADAGDEIFCGYKSYPQLASYINQLNHIPSSLKGLINKTGLGVASLVPNKFGTIKHKIEGMSRSVQKDNLKQAYDLFNNMNNMPKEYSNLFLNYDEYVEPFSHIDYNGFHNPIEVAMAVDYISYLQDDILTKVDRATMSVSLEGREPFLDHRIIEYVAQLPFEYKFENNISKKILKDIVHQYIPKEMMDRPKSGFSLPIYSWLNKDLSFLIDEYLNRKEISKSGLFNIEFVEARVKEFKQGKLHYVTFIWKMLMFQMWYNKWI